jgi:hypothetical protein
MRDGICDEALEWPDDEDFINARLQEIWGLEGWPCARLARAIRNQIGMLKGIQPPEFSQERFVIWAETLVHDLDEREMKKHLQAGGVA